ncbi:MAG TPA: sugar phosphate nucleotidyltransferase [Vitreimonas sp.]|nr:sugar phosphate nucleotidyltransferase [Vitreimonas sp.]
MKPTVLIITGGASSRLFPINTHNKGYFSLLGKALISRTIENFLAHGFEDIVVVVPASDPEGHQLSQLLQDDGITHPIQFVVQTEAKGQADAILSARGHLKSGFIVSAPYHFQGGELAAQLWQQKQSSGAACVYLGAPTETPELYGIISYQGDRFISVVEKPAREQAPSHLKIVALYLFDQTFLDTLTATPENEYALEDAITTHARDHHDSWVETNTKTLSLKYPWHLFSFQSHLFTQLKSSQEGTAAIAKTALIDDSHGPVVTSAGARVGDFVKLVGPCFIGPNAVVGDYSFVRESSIEANSTIGANTEVVRSIILKNSSLHFGYLADSIIGNHVKIGAGLITANKRLDRRELQVTIKDKKVNVGRNNLGIIVGDKANIGISVNTMPGVMIGAEAIIFPGTTLYHSVAKQAVFKG